MEGEDSLKVVFREFCYFGMGSRNTGPAMMDSRQCQKLCRDCGLLDKLLTKVEVDLIFTKVKGRGERRIDYQDFLECLNQFAEKKEISFEEICDIVANSKGPTLNHVTTPDSHKFTSPIGTFKGTSPSSEEKTPPPKKSSSQSTTKGKIPPLHPDWFQVSNPHPQGADELYYYVNRYTKETTWDRPILEEDMIEDQSNGVEEEESNTSFEKPSPPHRSVFDKLTDPSYYTGTHKYRFDPETGQGLGLRGRDRILKGTGTALDSPSTFKGNTNTNTDEVFSDISQFVRRG